MFTVLDKEELQEQYRVLVQKNGHTRAGYIKSVEELKASPTIKRYTNKPNDLKLINSFIGGIESCIGLGVIDIKKEGVIVPLSNWQNSIGYSPIGDKR